MAPSRGSSKVNHLFLIVGCPPTLCRWSSLEGRGRRNCPRSSLHLRMGKRCPRGSRGYGGWCGRRSGGNPRGLWAPRSLRRSSKTGRTGVRRGCTPVGPRCYRRACVCEWIASLEKCDNSGVLLSKDTLQLGAIGTDALEQLQAFLLEVGITARILERL